VLIGLLTGTMLMAGALYLSFRDLSRLQFAYFFLVTLGLLLVARAGLRLYHRAIGRSRPGWRNRILIVGAGHLGLRAAQILIDQSRWGYALTGFLDDDPAKLGKDFLGHAVVGPVENVAAIALDRKVDEVWICLPGRSYQRIQWTVAELEKIPVRIKIAPDYFSLALVRARAELVGGIPLIGLREPVITGFARFVKRVFDIAVASLLLLVLIVPMGLIALAIRFGSAGPIIFRQTRVGENGRLFRMLKFRTMSADAESAQGQINLQTAEGKILHKLPDDPRVTGAGRFLRRYSLDELPQLWNVLVGDMSLVGPRPELPWLVDRYEPWQRKRFAVPQGLTGWWQINGRSDKPMHLTTEDDLFYVYNYSLWLDMRILLGTPLAVLQGRGAF
jgi:exopolysaccharide biosynthesis polyprenyl glycosylphosphotransferase